jgi:RNA polymerase sigma-70 factor (ECF subfamily)
VSDDGDPDAALVTAAQGGDRAALERLLARHQDRLWAVCRRTTGDDADGADALQEALLAIVRGLPRFDGRSRFGTWAHRVAVNASLDELRRRRRRPSPTLDRQAPGRADEPVDAALGPDEAIPSALLIDEALQALPPDQRAAVVLRDVCDLDYAEIAEVLGVPIGTVRSRISRGRAALAPHLGGNRPAPSRRPTGAP